MAKKEGWFASSRNGDHSGSQRSKVVMDTDIL